MSVVKENNFIKKLRKGIKIMTKEPDENVIKELTNRLIDSRTLVKILKGANAEKDLLINNQAIELVRLNLQLAKHNKIFDDVSKIIGDLENE